MCRSRVLACALVAAAVTWNLFASPPPASAAPVRPTPPPPRTASLVELSPGSTAPAAPLPMVLLAELPREATTAMSSNPVVARDNGASPTPGSNESSLATFAAEHDITWAAITEEHADRSDVVQVDWAAVRAEAATTDGPPLIPLPTGALSGLAGLAGLALIGARRFLRWLY